MGNMGLTVNTRAANVLILLAKQQMGCVPRTVLMDTGERGVTRRMRAQLVCIKSQLQLYIRVIRVYCKHFLLGVYKSLR